MPFGPILDNILPNQVLGILSLSLFYDLTYLNRGVMDPHAPNGDTRWTISDGFEPRLPEHYLAETEIEVLPVYQTLGQQKHSNCSESTVCIYRYALIFVICTYTAYTHNMHVCIVR